MIFGFYTSPASILVARRTFIFGTSKTECDCTRGYYSGKTVKAPAMFADLCHVERVVAILPRAVSRDARTHACTHAHPFTVGGSRSRRTVGADCRGSGRQWGWLVARARARV